MSDFEEHKRELLGTKKIVTYWWEPIWPLRWSSPLQSTRDRNTVLFAQHCGRAKWEVCRGAEERRRGRKQPCGQHPCLGVRACSNSQS